ncbi:MAG: hypothetical protein KO316_08875 [Methanobacterium sp.]|nr:hypothetical protein [Methanobacterium sp.]
MEKLSKILAAMLIIVVALFAYVLIFGLSFEGTESDSYVPAVIGANNISIYKNSCSEINVSTLVDYNALNGKLVKVTGQISEKYEYIQFGKTRTFILLNVPGLSPEPYITTSYTGTLPYNVNDTVTVYGEYFFPICVDSPPELANKDLIDMKAGYIEKT